MFVKQVVDGWTKSAMTASTTKRHVILLQILPQLVLYKQSYFSQTEVERMLLLILWNLQVHPVIVPLSWISTVCNFHQILLDGAQGWCGKPKSATNQITLPSSHHSLVPRELFGCCELSHQWNTGREQWFVIGEKPSPLSLTAESWLCYHFAAYDDYSCWISQRLSESQIPSPPAHLRAGCVCWMDFNKSSLTSCLVAPI